MLKGMAQSLFQGLGYTVVRNETYQRIVEATAPAPQGGAPHIPPSYAGQDNIVSTPGFEMPAADAGRPLPEIYNPVYNFDGFTTDPAIIHNHDFMRDPRYLHAYARSVSEIGRDHSEFWRLHTALWAADMASHLPGDFVECGVWRGFMSTAIMNYLDWNAMNKNFFLLDTFEGMDDAFLTDTEKENSGKIDHLNYYYKGTWDFVKDHFKAYPRVTAIKGTVPETLSFVTTEKVAYLSLDMNCVLPEIAAAEFFWPKLVPGAVIVLDDYGFVSYEEQKQAFDKFAAERGISVLALPTGQGLMIKP